VIFGGWTEFPAHEKMLSAELHPMGWDRPDGIHLSEVIHEWKKGLGEKVGAIEGAQEGVQLIDGFLWEVALEYMCAGVGVDQAMDLAFKRYMTALRSDIVTQIKLEKDGIHMTPDGFNEKEGLMESYKCTRRSVKKATTEESFKENFWPWIVQEQSYCLAKGVDTARWIVLWQAGDYSGAGTPPKILELTITWSLDELIENWGRVKAHAERMREREKLQCDSFGAGGTGTAD